MTRIKKALIVFLNAALFVVGPLAFAQYTLIEQTRVEISRSLSGHVSAGLEKSPMENVTVELRSSDWSKVVASTKTDKDGYFSFGSLPEKLFYVRFSAPGMDPFQLPVRLKKNAKKDLSIHLTVAT